MQPRKSKVMKTKTDNKAQRAENCPDRAETTKPVTDIISSADLSAANTMCSVSRKEFNASWKMLVVCELVRINIVVHLNISISNGFANVIDSSYISFLLAAFFRQACAINGHNVDTAWG